MSDGDECNRKRALSDLNSSDDALLPDSKRRKLNEITKEDTDFLLQFKQEQSASLRTTSTYPHNPNNFFSAPSIHSNASSVNDTAPMDALSNIATTHSIAPIKTMTSDENKESVSEKYYQQIVHRSSRIGKEYQALTIPIARKQSSSNNHEKYGGSPIKNECPQSIAQKLRKERNEKRKKCLKNEEENEEYVQMTLNDINLDDDDEDESDDEDFNFNECENESLRIMEGIMGRRSDWLYGDDGIPNDQNTKLQYLVKWKDSKQPIWEFADNLEAYQAKIDLFEDDEMEDMYCDNDEDVAANDSSEKAN